MQAIQLKNYMLEAEDQAFTRRLAINHGLDVADLNKVWTIRGLTIVFLKDEITGAEISQTAGA